MKHIIIRGKKLDPPQALFTCEHCGCFFETDEFHIIERYDKIYTKEYYLTSCPQCGRDVERLESEDAIPPEDKKRKWQRFRYEENNRYEKQEIFLKPKYAYTNNEKTWYACPKCGHLIAYLAPRCNNCKNKMKWSKKK